MSQKKEFRQELRRFTALAMMGLALGAGLTGCFDDDEEPVTRTPLSAGDTVLVGAQGDTTYGSAVDLDLRQALKVAQANVSQQTLDLIFAFHEGSVRIMT